MLVRTSPKESMPGLLNSIKAETRRNIFCSFQDNFRLQSTHERYT
jgi:hypothetical protein